MDDGLLSIHGAQVTSRDMNRSMKPDRARSLASLPGPRSAGKTLRPATRL